MDGMGASDQMKWKCEGNILLRESMSGIITYLLFGVNDILMFYGRGHDDVIGG